jgi:hypothetical protein
VRRFNERYYSGRAVAGRTFDPHYRSETIEDIPPSSEGVAFKPATWCLLGRVYRTKDIGLHHAHPRVKRMPKAAAFQRASLGEIFKERRRNLTRRGWLSSDSCHLYFRRFKIKHEVPSGEGVAETISQPAAPFMLRIDPNDFVFPPSGRRMMKNCASDQNSED